MDEKLTLNRYCGLMEEIKRRITVVNTCLTQPVFEPRFMYETCYLQFRMICELIALGCLVAHDDIPGMRTAWFQKSIDVPAMMKAMTKLHPEFYPEPGKQIRHPDGRVEVMRIKDGYLTKQELMRLHAKAGEVVHRGSYRTVFERPRQLGGSEEVGGWLDKIITLLNHHQIALADETIELWVMMQGRKDGRVHGYIMQRIE